MSQATVSFFGISIKNSTDCRQNADKVITGAILGGGTSCALRLLLHWWPICDPQKNTLLVTGIAAGLSRQLVPYLVIQ
jgi:hypothetical protein